MCRSTNSSFDVINSILPNDVAHLQDPRFSCPMFCWNAPFHAFFTWRTVFDRFTPCRFLTSQCFSSIHLLCPIVACPFQTTVQCRRILLRRCLREIARGQIQGGADGRLKLLFHPEDKSLLGAHIVGEGATELVHIGQAIIALGGALDYLCGAVFNYPTFAEAYNVAALDA
ncbi:MAG: hypothetical protein WBN40_01850 [Pseudomonadales bacterium]